MYLERVVETDDEFLVEDLKGVYEQLEVMEGENKVVFSSFRDSVFKATLHEPSEYNVFEEAEKTKDIDPLPWTYTLGTIEVPDEDEELAIFKQEMADKNHSEVLEEYGWRKTLQATTAMFDRLLDHGFAYRDSKPENIGFFEEDGFWVPKPIDFLDKVGYIMYEGRMSEDELYFLGEDVVSQFQHYLEGSTKEDGLIDLVDADHEDADEMLRALTENSRYMKETGVVEGSVNRIRGTLNEAVVIK